MKRQIGICVLLSLGIVLIYFALKARSQNDVNTEKETESEITSEAANENNYKYKIVEEEGKLTVYDMKSGTKFLESAIESKLLPKEIQRKLEMGIYFKNDKDMYDFLESYSS